MKSESILLIGQGRWSQSLAEGLAKAGLTVETATLDGVGDALSSQTWRRVSRAGVIVRVGFRPGARTWRGLAFDLALRLFKARGARNCCYWIGTDVLHLCADVAQGARTSPWRSPAFAAHTHFAGSEPLRRELASAGLGAALVGFPWRTVTAPSPLPPMPERFTVTTYVPDSRNDFYGGPIILEVARRMPAVRFEVMGSTGSWAAEVPPNVEFLGWVADPAECYARASCVVRLPRHDSIGGTAVEGLLFGRPVLYSKQLEHTETVVRSADAVAEALGRLVQRHVAKTLVPDEEAAAWARESFDPDRRFAELAQRLRSLRAGTPTRQPRLTYLTLQATSEGQAAHAHVHEIVKGLAHNRWAVRLIKPAYPTTTPGPARRVREFARLQVSAVAGLPRSDVFYVRAHFAAWPAAVMARLLKVPVVQEVNGPHADAFMVWPALRRVRRMVEWLNRTQLRLADAVITVTPQLITWIAEDAGVRGAHLVSNGADTELFRPERPALVGLPSRYVVFFGALAPWQGIPIALEATRTDRWPEGVALLVVGDGQLRPEVEAAADGRRILYIGRRPYGEIGAIVSNSLGSLVPMPSIAHSDGKGEGRDHSQSGLAPLKLFESMACGVPVVASDLPGLRETVTDAGCGLLVTPGDPVALANAVRRLVENPEAAQVMGSRGRDSAERQHSWQRRADDTDALLFSLRARTFPR